MNGKLNKLKQKIMYVVNISEIRNQNKPRAFFRKISCHPVLTYVMYRMGQKVLTHLKLP